MRYSVESGIAFGELARENFQKTFLTTSASKNIHSS